MNEKEDIVEIKRLAVKVAPLLLAIPAIYFWMNYNPRPHGAGTNGFYDLVLQTGSLITGVTLGFILIYEFSGGKSPHWFVDKYQFIIGLGCVLGIANFLMLYESDLSLYGWTVVKLRDQKRVSPEKMYAQLYSSVVSKRWVLAFEAIDPKTGATKGEISTEIRIRTYIVSAYGLQAFEADEVGANAYEKCHYSYIVGPKGAVGSWYDDLIPTARGGKFIITPRPSVLNVQWFEGQFNDEKRATDPSDYWMRNFKIAPLGNE